MRKARHTFDEVTNVFSAKLVTLPLDLFFLALRSVDEPLDALWDGKESCGEATGSLIDLLLDFLE